MFRLPFQNKLMNLLYVFNDLEDKMYITRQHKMIDMLLQSKHSPTGTIPKTGVINIGLISGDFVDHPVSYFLSTFLKLYDTKKFKLTCYSECIIKNTFNDAITFKIIRNVNTQDAVKLIKGDDIHILLDISGHTAHNRLDIFAERAAPVQINYLGYPFTTGLSNMDYRITDNICDSKIISQKFYTEKLLFASDCFLCYSPKKEIPIKVTTSEHLRIGCFNRLNKINEDMVDLFNDILLRVPNSTFMFKTKALINTDIAKEFLNKFDNSVRSRITIRDCTVSHDEHLSVYNEIDIAIDTFPYSGTTTSCESLYMGVPVYTVYDSEYYFHPQNVTSSILVNSNLNEFVCDSTGDLISKVENFTGCLKDDIRKRFLGGNVCNQEKYIKNFEKLLLSLQESNSTSTSEISNNIRCS